jgi:tetratricopeptide (TPR) repeat protein
MLLGTWLVLMAVGVLSVVKPNWQEDWSDLGESSEAIAYKRYGDAFLHRAEYRKAVPQYLKALEIDSGQAAVMVNLAVAYRHLGMNRKSAEMLFKASRINADQHGLIAFNLGELAEAAGKHEEALTYYRRAAAGELVERDLVYRKIGSLLLQKGQFAGAAEAFRQCLDAQLDDERLYRQMLLRAHQASEGDDKSQAAIRDQLAQGLDDDSRKRFDLNLISRLRQSDPEIAKTHNHLGYIFYQLQQIDSAHAHFAKSLAIWPDNKDATSGLAAISRAGESRVQSNRAK